MNKIANEVPSPLDNNIKAKLISSTPSRDIVNGYKRFFKIDCNRFFKGVKDVLLYECSKSRYRFFAPQNLSGDNRFYIDLSKKQWYYLKWKWEHEVVKQFLIPGQTILEIGCGNGEFLKVAKNEKEINCVGLELNNEAVSKGVANELDLRSETIQAHAQSNSEKYDVVCAFQVLEHISDVRSFLESSIGCLKSGGVLALAVPNNDSFIKDDPLPLLNLPPHHMGRWNSSSLKNLEYFFPIKIQEILFEPFQDYHFDYYKKIILMKKLSSIYMATVLSNFKIADIFLKDINLKNLKKNIVGHSVLAIFKKK